MLTTVPVPDTPTVAGLATSFGSGAMTNSINEILGAELLFLIGTNTTEAHPVIGYKMKQAKQAGAKLIVVDPRRTELAEEADYWLQIKPGTDIPLLNSIMHIIIKRTSTIRSLSKSAQRTLKP